MPFWNDALKKVKEATEKAAQEAAKAAQEAADAAKKGKSNPTQEREKDDTQDTVGQASKAQAPPKQRYKKIARWLKEKYGDQFKEGDSIDEIEKQLTKIFKEDIEPNFISEPKYVKGWKSYIAQRQYGDLVSVE